MGESEDGPMAVDKVRDTGVGAVSGIVGTGGGGGCADCSSAVVVSVLMGPRGFELPSSDPSLEAPSSCGDVGLESSVDISTGVGLGRSSLDRLGC